MKSSEGIQTRLKESENKEFRSIINKQRLSVSNVVQELVRRYNNDVKLQNSVRVSIEIKKPTK